MSEPTRPDPKKRTFDPLRSVYGEVTAKTPGQPTTGKPGSVPGEPAEPPEVPAAFGRYRVERLIGSGGYGSVYLAHDAVLGRPVAVKAFPSASTDAAERDAFMGEARRVARLRHAGIVSVHDVGIQEPWIYIVSDFLDGSDLDAWLKSNRPPWTETVRIVAAIADALAHAHAKRIIHRDIKPGNIILADGQPVLVDFGISLDEGKTGASELGIVCGTPAYMSPEQVSGQAHRIDGRTDLYSLGAVLYEMLCGRPPFASPDLTELLRMVADDDPQPPRQLVPELPSELEKVCLRAMAKDQNLRYTTAADLAADLRKISDAPAKAVTPRSRLTGPVDRSAPPTTSRPREAERRQVTVLVSVMDAFESEAFLQELEPEEQAEVIRLFQSIGDAAVRVAGGTLVESGPKGLVACFGYPIAQEDAARRAASAGLSILDDVMKFRSDLPRGGWEFSPRTAIHTGSAVVQAVEGAVSVVGDARNVASRLQEFAAADHVVCSGTTHRLLERYFACTSLGPRKIKGAAEPVEVFVIGDARPPENPINALPAARLSPLTGRDLELNLLQGRWEQAQEGMGQVVLLIGEAGLGKSRLVHTIGQHARKNGASEQSIIEWRCSPQSVNSDLYPAREFFERLLGFQRGEEPAARFERLLRHLEPLQLARKDIVPFFASLLSLPLDDRFPAQGLTPAREREETFRALRDWLRACASVGPVLFIVEDLHWVDASTLEFLGQCLAEGLRNRMLTLLTFRPEFQTPWPALAHQTTLALNRLTRRQVSDLMRAAAGAETLSDELVGKMHDRTGGVPLFVEEYARLLQSSGELPREIPGTLQDLVMSRLDRMTSERDVVQMAAVLGREFTYEQLAAVTALDEPTLQSELSKLVVAELLYPKGQPPRCAYLFKHALLQDAAYASLVKSRRQQHHRKFADVLEEQFPQTVAVQPELLAHHRTEAGETAKAIDAWLQAGSKSLGHGAQLEAIGQLRRGLGLVETMPESPDRDGLEIAFLKPLGMALMSAKGYSSPEAGTVMRRARLLAERIGHPAQLFATMWGVWAWHVVRAEYPLCMKLSEEALDFARRLGEPGILQEALFMPGITKYSRGEFGPALAHFEEALSRYDDRARGLHWAQFTGQDAGITNRCYRALTLWHLGRPDEARKIFQETTALAATIPHPFTRAYVQHHSAWFYFNCRLARETAEAAEEGRRQSDEGGFEIFRATSRIFKAAALLLGGKPAEAIPGLLDGIAMYRATGAEMALPFHYSLVAQARLNLGRFEESEDALGEAFKFMEKNDDRFREAALHRLRGELVLAETGDEAAAEGHFLTSLGVARRQKSRALELKTALALGRLRIKQGRPAEAKELVQSVASAFTEGFDLPDLKDAAAIRGT